MMAINERVIIKYLHMQCQVLSGVTNLHKEEGEMA